MNAKTNVANLQGAGKLIAREAGAGTVKAFFEKNKGAMAAILPNHVKPERMLRIALGALRTTPKLTNATIESLMSATMVCAQLGLEPNTVLGHCYLIPFDNRRQKRTDVQIIIGYKGLIDLARRSGQIESIAAHAVYSADQFDYAYGLNETLEHRPAVGNRGEIVAFYAVAKLKDGGHAFEVMSKDDVDAIMRKTQSKGAYGPWKDHYEEMGRKTVIRRLSKYLPLSIEFSTAATIDGLAEAGKDQHLESALEGEYALVPDDEHEHDHDESTGATTLPAYPEDQFARDLTQWRNLIESGKQTADGLVAILSSRYAFTDDQIAQIKANPTTGEVLPDEAGEWQNDYDKQEAAQ
ncbi:MAG: recombination protein RecT [Gammaproteobacteria bacterium]|nr:recombination protein RecT [Gammaproteobacteria bacterium]